MPIRVYPSLLPGEPIEVHETEGLSLADWLTSKNLDFRAQAEQPILVKVNGVELPVAEWDTRVLGRADEVEIRIVPHGGAFKAIGKIFKILDPILNWFLGSMTPKNSTPSQQQGEKLETGQATANRARLGEVVAELAGRHRIFPAYLTPPRRFFAAPREQWVEFLCCLGPGDYAVNPEDVKVGDTPFSSLGNDAAYAFFPPGADLSGVPAHEHWYSVDEVGGTSSGTAGLDLSVEFTANIDPTAGTYVFDDQTVTIPPGMGEWPEPWGNGTVLDIRLPLVYDVTVEGGGEDPPRNRFHGNFRETAPTIGMTLRASGGLSGNYVVFDRNLDSNGDGWLELTFNDEVVDDLPSGQRTITFWRPARRYRVFSVTPQEITIDAITGGSIETGWAGFPAVTSTTATFQADKDTVFGEWTSLFRACPSNERTDTIEIDFFLPAGLAYVEDDGDLSNRSVQVEIRYRDATVGGAFSSVTKIYTANTLDQIGYTERLSVPLMLPEVQIRRVGAQDASTQVQDKIQWYGLRSRLPTRTSYPNWTTMVARVKSGGRLGAQSENQVNVVATRVLPVLGADGQWLAPQPTRDISAFVRYIAHSIGYTDSDLEMSELLRLHNVWAARGETVDYVYDETTVKEAINLALGAGMAEMTIRDGQIMPVRDDVRTQFEQPYSPQNMTGPLRRNFRSRRIDDADGVEVEFTNAETWKQETVRCLLPGDAAFKLDKLTVKGVTDRTRAWRIGMRRRRALRYRNWEYAFATEMDAFNSRYLSYVPLIDGDPGYGVSAILEHIEPSGDLALMHLSEPLEWIAGQDHVVAFRRPDGSLAGPFDATPGPDEYSVLADITEAWPVVTLKQEPPHVYFGTMERWCFPALIKNINPRGLAAADVEAENYDVRVYASDNAFPPT